MTVTQTRGPELAAPSPSRRTLPPTTAGALAGIVVFALVVLLRAAGVLNGLVMIAVLLALVLLLPVGRTLSRRILLTFPILLGGVPMLWWVPWPNLLPDRGTLVLAIAAGAVAAATAGGLAGGRGAGRLLPRISPIDFIPLLAGVGAASVQLNYLTVRGMDQALSLLSTRWDHASHFNMFYMLRTEGQVIPLLPPSPDGSQWSFNDYPQGFHSLLATLSELVHGDGPTTAAAELVSYANLSAVVVVLAVVMVAAGLCALPRFRHNQLLGAPVAALVAAGWVLGPGASAFMHGFANFFLAVSLTAAAVLLTVSMDRLTMAIPLAAAASAVVGIANNWMPLLLFIPGALVMVCLPASRSRWKMSTRSWTGTALILVAAVIGTAVALYQVASVEVTDVLTAGGGFPAVDFGLLWFLVLACAVLYVLAFSRRGRDSTTRSAELRARWSVLVLASGVLVAIGMSALQITDLGELSYYALKLILALQLMSLVLLGLMVMHVVRLPAAPLKRRSRRRTRGTARVIASAVSVLAATQFFGSTVSLPELGLPAAATGVLERTEQDQRAAAGVPNQIRSVIRAVESNEGTPAMYLTTSLGQIDPILAQQWYSGLTRTYTEKNWTLSWHLFPLYDGADRLEEVVTAVLDEEPEALLVVDQENEALLEQILRDRE
ncbi:MULTISPECIES: hypothetical protein [unclassified Arthrobacter]|uniref:hypothetical protein n=1 Tax=unclassified Arthrobacter TaxID=235627 RepID=UPI001E634094|nr:MULTISPECIES: hypothetical protein [unclassified Arthrobacter]MCC9146464.1 hypothetical protein [Arthrobacter sp. zg-Y919]MDK1277694.1 hypothetical protein [Arthrobacter sp. zg.Y919]WIB02348.1 hypothetical protein QNO10_10290 [Arthrobacter sp. zg-Y919]